MSPLRAFLLSTAVLAVVAVPAAAAGDPILPLSQVQRGMKCTGYSVVRGTDVASFDAVVDDVVYDAVDSADILITISGAAVEDGGAGPGFSGSPIYCPSPADGTPSVIGGLSFGIGDYDNKTVLVTPIEAMLGEPVTPPTGARRATARERRARPLGTTLGVSGLSPRVAEVFRAAARRAGRTLFAAPSGARATQFPVQTLRPGSAVSVGYSSGDVGLGATGTVTYVDGADVWAFGHPLDSVGRRSLFLQDAYVYGVIASPSIGGGQSTYKLAAPGHDIGTLTGDGEFAVTGIVGPLPPHFPLTVTANDRDRDTTRTLHVQIADERVIGNPTGFSPLGLVGSATIAQAAYSALHGSPITTSGSMCVTVRATEAPRPMGFCNTYVEAGTGLATEGAGALAGAAPVVDFGSVASLIDSYKLGPLHITDISATLDLSRGLAQAFLLRAGGPKAVARGADVPVRLSYRRAGGEPGTLSFTVHVPHGIPRGKRDLVLTGTPSDLAGGGFSSLLAGALGGGDSDEAGPRSLASLARQIRAIHRFDGISASFRPRHGKGELAAPTAPDALPAGAEGRAQRERPVYRDGAVRFSGAVAIPVVVG